MSNHLNDATSPYLLQHAENPVDWYPWCEEAFKKAKAEDKPIFLSIGAIAPVIGVMSWHMRALRTTRLRRFSTGILFPLRLTERSVLTSTACICPCVRCLLAAVAGL